MDRIGAFTPEQANTLWQDYLTRQQLQPRLQNNYPDRRPVYDDQTHRVFVKNTGDETVPSYGCMQITGVDLVADRTVLTVEKPTSTDGDYILNSQFPIPAVSATESGAGWAYRYGVVRMLGDEPGESGASYGPVVDSWEVKEGDGPFTVFGRDDFSGRALIGRVSTGGKPGERIMFLPTDVCTGIGFTCDCVTASVVTSACGSAISPGSEVQVWDLGRGYFQMPPELLFRSLGFATYMKVHETYDRPEGLEGDCRWVVDTMLCTEQVAGS